MDTSRRLTLNVGGQLFQTTVDTLRSLPSTRLGRLATDTSLNHQPDTQLFFDRNPEIMNSILDLYRTGELHLPKHLCCHTVENELKFWDLPIEVIRECCYKSFDCRRNDTEIIRKIDKFLTNPYETEAAVEKLSRWNRVWLIMERPRLCGASKIWSAIFFSFVLMSVLVYTLQTSTAFRTYQSWVHAWAADRNMTVQVFTSTLNLVQRHFASQPVSGLYFLEYALFAFFVLEFLVRLVTCPSKAYFFRLFRSWLDLFLVVQHGVGILVEHNMAKGFQLNSAVERNALHFFFSLSVLKVLRIFYLAKDFEAMKVLLLSTRASLKVLGLLTVSLLSLATMFGAFVYLAELLEEGSSLQSIQSILYGIWYAVVTMTTVGYGDFYPITTSGRLIGALCAMSGLVVIALPVTVIATNFSSYHDNITARRQMRTRLSFLKDNPGFCTRHHESVDDPGEKEKSETKDKKPQSERSGDGITPLFMHSPVNSVRPLSGFGSVRRNSGKVEVTDCDSVSGAVSRRSTLRHLQKTVIRENSDWAKRSLLILAKTIVSSVSVLHL